MWDLPTSVWLYSGGAQERFHSELFHILNFFYCFSKPKCLQYYNFDYYILTLLSGDCFKIEAICHNA